MATHTKRWTVETNNVQRQYSKDYTSNGEVRIDGESIANGQTDQEYTIAIDVSAVKSFYLVADGGALTVETNNGSSPTNTIALVDGVPYEWNEDSYDSFLLTGDVTSLFFTNASGSAVSVYLECIFDGSP